LVSKTEIMNNLNNTLKKTDFSFSNKFEGKVRETYDFEDKKIIIVSDRISAFDRILTTIPFKGQVLNEMSAFWFNATKNVFPNHVIDVPDPQVMIAKKCSILPIEVIVRGYLTGSAWRDYEKGNSVSGINLSEGMKNWQKFETPLLTPSTKEEQGLHDKPVSREEIISQKIIEPELYYEIEKAAINLFNKGSEIAAENGLILVDTKYEFGLHEGKLIVADEMHTSDSSRYWIKETYNERFNQGIEPQVLDKEFLRQWLIKEKNFMGDGEIPLIPDEIRTQVSEKYIKAFELITGKKLEISNEPVLKRIERNLKEKGYL
jgi:phosphoribosylaminoimidazole-succinocarboxamide synthase